MNTPILPPEPGAVVWCEVTRATVKTLARVEGFEDSVVVELFQSPTSGPRRVHRRNYFVRTDPNLRGALDKLSLAAQPPW